MTKQRCKLRRPQPRLGPLSDSPAQVVQAEGRRLGLDLTTADAWRVVMLLGSQACNLATVRDVLKGHAALAWGGEPCRK